MIKILAISSPGGHWVQLCRLLPIFESKNVVFACTYDKAVELDKSCIYHKIEDISRDSIGRLWKACWSVFCILKEEKPTHVLTTGALPGLLALILARFLGSKTIWIDSIANSEKMSLSGTLASFFAHDCFTQWEHLSSNRVKYIGRVI